MYSNTFPYKVFYAFVLLLLALPSGVNAQYCSSYGNSSDGYQTNIRRVRFNTIDNSSNSSDSGYANYTSISTNLTAGASYTLRVNVNTDGNYTTSTMVFIDWNQDGDFDDSNESYTLGTATNTSNGQTSASPYTLSVPSSALSGVTRMRVSTRWNGYPGSCEQNFDGEVEEYSINVSGVSQPEIAVYGFGTEIADGDTTPYRGDDTDFGSTAINTSITKTFTIENFGSANLSLSGASPYVSISGTNAANFSITTAPANLIASGNSTTFQVTFTAATAGMYTAQLSISNNDSNENPYNFSISATATPDPDSIYTIYYEDFDQDNGGWSSVVNNSDYWTWTDNFGGSAELGEGGFWRNNSYDNYLDNTYIVLQSASYDLSGYTDMRLQLDVRHDTESAQDGMNIYYTTDGGANFYLLGNNSGLNWYNGNVAALSADGWSDTNNGSGSTVNKFMNASTDLDNASFAGQSNVIFFVIFRTGGSNTDNGVAIDNFQITGTPTVAVQEASNGPADITGNLRLWLKTTNGISTTSGNPIVNWEDQAYDTSRSDLLDKEDATARTVDAPTYYDDLNKNLNYNPAVDFDNSSTTVMKGKGGYFSKEYYVVVKSDDVVSNSTGSGGAQYPIGGKFKTDDYTTEPTGLGLGSVSVRYSNEVVSHTINAVNANGSASPDDGINTEAYGSAFSSSSTSYDQETLILTVKNNPTNTGSEIYKNGLQINDTPGRANNGGELYFNEFNNLAYMLGADKVSLSTSQNRRLNGRLGEVISYSVPKSESDQLKIQSYLGLKFGVTLHAKNSTTVTREGDVDYVDSNGNTIWDSSANSGFNYDIAGIGRDDDSGLSQKQSQSDNTGSYVTMSLGSRFNTNSTNTNNFDNDKDFLIWGNDNGPMTAGTPVNVDLSSGMGDPALATGVEFIPINRIWKVVETKQAGDGVPTVTVSIDETALTSVLTPPGNFLMFISNGAAFDPSAEFRVMKLNGSKLECTYDFDGTKYITFGYAPERVYERSILFNGTTDFMDADDHMDLASNFTLSAWIRQTGAGTIISKNNEPFTAGYELNIDSDSQINFEYKGSFGVSYTLNSTIAIPNDEWHHVAVSYDGSYIQLYIDGVADERVAASFTPENNSSSFLISASGSTKNPTDFFGGHIDEVRVWNTALSKKQIRYIMNQEIEEFTDATVNGLVIPQDILKNNVSSIPWTDLAGYYPMTTYTYTNVKDHSSYDNYAALRNLKTVDYQTAPLPYISQADGTWETDATWLNNAVQQIPASASIVDPSTTVNWNIVRTNHVINTTDNVKVLGLFLESNSITTGNSAKVDITHYFELDGLLDLKDESQLIQRNESVLKPSSSGYILQRQQGTPNKYNYNYWSSPVNPQNTLANNTDYSVKGIMKDETTGTVSNLWFTGGYDGSPSSPATISTFWLYRFADLNNDYDNWQKIGENTLLKPGQGFTMKGPGSGTTEQPYVFSGKPNNATSISPVELTITAGNSYLVGNPFPSAMNADNFINDNTHLSGTLYFWEHWGGNSHVLREYQGGYAMYNLSGGVAPMAHPDVSQVNAAGSLKGAPSKYIPVGQGFFVDADVSGTIIFDNTQRTFVRESTSSTTFFRAKTAKGKAPVNSNMLPPDDSANDVEDTRPKLRLGFDNEDKRHRQLLVTADPNTTMGYDRKYDGKVYEDLSDDLHWKLEDDEYIIQGIPEFYSELVLPLTVKLTRKEDFTINIDSLQNFPEDLGIYIKDKTTETYTDLRATMFSANLEEGKYSDRFELVFRTDESLSVEDQPVTSNDLFVFYRKDDRKIVIRKNSAFNIEGARLYNLLGQEIQRFNTDASAAESELQVNMIATGTYLLQLDTDKGQVSKKLIIQ